MEKYSWKPNPCQNGHVFIWTAPNITDKIPEGILCQCGQTRLKCEVRAIKTKETKDLIMGDGE